MAERERLTGEGLKSGAQTRVTASMLSKAQRCIKVATLMLGEQAEKEALEQQALTLMDLPDENLMATYQKLSAGQNAPDAFDAGNYPDTHQKVKQPEELREPKGKKRKACGCDETGKEVAIPLVLTEASIDQLESELANRLTEEVESAEDMTKGDHEPMPKVEESDDNDVVDKEEEVESTMTKSKVEEKPSTSVRQSGEANDPASYKGQESEIDFPSLAEKAARLSAELREAKNHGKSGPRLASLSKKVSDWVLDPNERTLVIAAENAVKLAEMLKPVSRHSKLGERLYKLAAAVAEGLVSPDTGVLDQENEENSAWKPNYEAPASDSEKLVASEKKVAALELKLKKAEEMNPEKDVAPQDAPETRKTPSNDESTSDELPGHKAASTLKKVADDEEKEEVEETKESAEESKEEEKEEEEEEKTSSDDEIELGNNDGASIDAALAADDEEDTGVPPGASDEEVLDVLFEQDEEKASAKIAALGQKAMSKVASVESPKKVGAKKLGMGPKVASSKRDEIAMLQNALWTSKPDVRKYFGQGGS